MLPVRNLLLFMVLFTVAGTSQLLDFSLDNVLQVKPKTYSRVNQVVSFRALSTPFTFVSSVVYNNTHLFLGFTRELFIVLVSELLSARPSARLEDLPSTRVVFPNTKEMITSIAVSEAMDPPVLLLATLRCELYQLDLWDLLTSSNGSQPEVIQRKGLGGHTCVSETCYSAVLLGSGWYISAGKADCNQSFPTRVASSPIVKNKIVPSQYPLSVEFTPLADQNHSFHLAPLGSAWSWGFSGAGGIYQVKDRMVAIYTADPVHPIMFSASITEAYANSAPKRWRRSNKHFATVSNLFHPLDVRSSCAIQVANTSYFVHYNLHTQSVAVFDYDLHWTNPIGPPQQIDLKSMVWHNNENIQLDLTLAQPNSSWEFQQPHNNNNDNNDNNNSANGYVSAVTCRLLHNKMVIIHHDVPHMVMPLSRVADFTDEHLSEGEQHLIKSNRAVILSVYVHSGLCYPHTIIMDCCGDDTLYANQIGILPHTQLLGNAKQIPAQYFSLKQLPHTVSAINASCFQATQTTSTHTITVMSAEHMSSCSLTIELKPITRSVANVGGVCSTILNKSITIPHNCSVNQYFNTSTSMDATRMQLVYTQQQHSIALLTSNTTTILCTEENTIRGSLWTAANATFTIPTVTPPLAATGGATALTTPTAGNQPKEEETLIKSLIVSQFFHSLDISTAQRENSETVTSNIIKHISLLNPVKCYLSEGMECGVSISIVDEHNNSNTCLLTLQVTAPPKSTAVSDPRPAVVANTHTTLWISISGCGGLVVLIITVCVVFLLQRRHQHKNDRYVPSLLTDLTEETVSVTRSQLETLNIVFSNEVIGKGGQAVVVKGMNNSTGGIVAIKIARTNCSNLAKEYEALCQIRHPNIVPAYAYLKQSSAFVMKYIGGGSLQSMLDAVRGIGLPLTTIIKYTHDILQGLDCLHSNGLVHRDLKPDNILIEESGCLIADLGCAKDSDVTTTGALIGTIRYLPPELFVESLMSPALRTSRDIWALGLIVVGMITGEQPIAELHNVFELGDHFIQRVEQGYLTYAIPYDLVYNKEGIVSSCTTNTTSPAGQELSSHTSNLTSDRQREQVESSKPQQQWKESRLADFLEKCLQYNGSNRSTAADLLSHPLFIERRKLHMDESPAALNRHKHPAPQKGHVPVSVGHSFGDTFTQSRSKNTMYLI